MRVQVFGETGMFWCEYLTNQLKFEELHMLNKGSPAAGLAANLAVGSAACLAGSLAQGLAAALGVGLAAGCHKGSSPCGMQSGAGTSCAKYNFSLAKTFAYPRAVTRGCVK